MCLPFTPAPLPYFLQEDPYVTTWKLRLSEWSWSSPVTMRGSPSGLWIGVMLVDPQESRPTLQLQPSSRTERGAH